MKFKSSIREFENMMIEMLKDYNASRGKVDWGRCELFGAVILIGKILQSNFRSLN
jgi:hypothetical protein